MLYTHCRRIFNLHDEVFVISKIIKVEVAELITLDITEKANLIIVLFDIKRGQATQSEWTRHDYP